MAVLSQAPPWYRDGLEFRCTQCGDCCRGDGYVWVDEAQIERIASHLSISREEMGRRYLRRVGNSVSLRDNASQDCIFWDRGCGIYPVRPRQCRTFPFWEENVESREAWRRVSLACPGVDEGERYDLVQIRRLAAGRSQTAPASPRPRATDRR